MTEFETDVSPPLPGYTCDVSSGTCDRSSLNIELTSDWDEECDDGTTCPGSTSCCKLRAGYYGCCPYPNAVCCQDEKHCCPNGLFIMILVVSDNYIIYIMYIVQINLF